LSKDDTDAKWTLTEEAFDKLLERFSPDRDEANRQYLLMRAKLGRFFERRSAPDELVDKTFDTVARKIDQGENIFNLSGYFVGVAGIVYKEWLRTSKFHSIPLDELPDLPDERPPDDEQKEERSRCLDECLGHQSIEKSELLLGYYSDVKRAKINHRRVLADTSTMNALRIRVCRSRKDVEKCVKECLKRKTDSK